MKNTALAVLVGALSLGSADESVFQRMEKDRAAVAEVRESIGAELAVTESYVRRSVISTRTPYGFKVKDVAPRTPAARAEIVAGDLLLEWGGKPIVSVAELREWIAAAEPGSTVTVTIARKKKNVGLLSRHPWEAVEAKIEIPKKR